MRRRERDSRPQSMPFVVLGHLGAELFVLNLGTKRVNRVEGADLATATRTATFEPMLLTGLDRHHLLDQGRPELLFGAHFERSGQAPPKRQLRTMLDDNCVPEGMYVLGSPGPSVAYASLDGNRSSTALVHLHKRFAIQRNTRTGKLNALFPKDGAVLSYPLLDSRAVATFPRELERSDSMRELSEFLGFRPGYLLIALAKVHGGYCKKVVVSILPEL
ncbi:MAG: hypothetical protein M0Z34_06020 [Nitrospiraceae bacterium]|nr:hypothetical protein [Nitrospiraceae bacterium]MDA8263282.1 hypothetical protein [Actinomycetota bacterium]